MKRLWMVKGGFMITACEVFYIDWGHKMTTRYSRAARSLKREHVELVENPTHL